MRNSVGFDWHPETGELWFTNNGRTGMVSNWYSQIAPDDTLSRVPTGGGFFGFPYCYQGAAGGAADAPCARLAGVGAAIPDPYLNPDERNMSCSPGLDWLEAPPRRAFWQHLQSIVKYVVGVLASDTKVTEGSGPLTQIYPAAQALGPHLISLGMTFYRCVGRGCRGVCEWVYGMYSAGLKETSKHVQPIARPSGATLRPRTPFPPPTTAPSSSLSAAQTSGAAG